MPGKWDFIEDLPSGRDKLSSGELPGLSEIWKNRRRKLEKDEVVKQFNDKLRREWAIETGIIEGLYTIDRGITTLLIEEGIKADLIEHGSADKPAEQIVSIVKSQEDVLEGIFDFVKHERELTTSYVKQLHQAFTKHQPTAHAVNGGGREIEVKLLKGEWKKLPNNPTRPDGSIHEYCLPDHVSAEMDRLIEMHAQHTSQKVAPEVSAAWLHHRFTQIHPFQDGNGRVARALASLVFLRDGDFPLVINRDIRAEYLTALESADSGDLQPLVNLFTNVQKRFFAKAFSIAESVVQDKKDTAWQNVISSAMDKLKASHDVLINEIQEKASALSSSLEKTAYDKLVSLSENLVTQLHPISRNYYATAGKSYKDNNHWFRAQIIETARKLGYYANTREYRAWTGLRIEEERETNIIISFHGLGHEPGIMAVSAFLFYKDKNDDKGKNEEGQTTVAGPHTLCKAVFNFSYLEEKENVIRRFQPWIDEVVLFGLDQWRRQL